MIQIRGVSKSFEGTKVLDGLDLDIPRQNVVTIIGPSGSGKSTLLRILDFLEHADSGTVDFGDGAVDLTTTKTADIRKVRSKIGFVFQNYNLFLNKNALENVAEPLIYAKGLKPDEARKIAAEQLDRVGLADYQDRFPSTLSGGQQQRVGIARAVAMNPELLVLDEPTSALDPEMVTGVLEVIRQLGKDGMTMLMVTHEMRFAYEASNHVVFIEGGHVIEQGDPKQLFEHPREERTAEFLSSTNNVLMIPASR
ncbi:amino acid ABC transporter ATP-binding protein [Bifidobacterium imperatoris]|uniref:Amino acid ABC transporter ATP-binding protein n=1 Tax=Bifidobacterium imperatoris TaxID=2020965 RepID=A0A2N5IV39_9BIFI|nr:amino acid ABC transporter ATP-binding protein [Bifidobacterium imperatoris]PLS25839.1 amino acid ABC transporter ATP-binding protein [Bifidobacterium imperatoris]QSY57868.1 amino acid ABC transporter ATP-binding protein [Bifidobacterium imperatoris]